MSYVGRTYDRIGFALPATVSIGTDVAIPLLMAYLCSLGGKELKGEGRLAGPLGLGQLLGDVHVRW